MGSCITCCCQKLEDTDIVLDEAELSEYRKGWDPVFSKDLNETPLVKVQITASHHPYIEGAQIGGKCTYEELVREINRGVRLLALDVMWSEETPRRLIITHYGYGVHVTTWLDFQKTCALINEWAWKYTDYPLILDLQYNNDCKSAVLEVIRNIFGSKFYEGAADAQTKLGALRGKVCFWTGDFVGHEHVPADYTARAKNKLCLIYPENIILTKNYDPIPWLNGGIQFVMMNYSNVDDYVKKYMEYFRKPIRVI